MNKLFFRPLIYFISFILSALLWVGCGPTGDKNYLRIAYTTEDNFMTCALGQILERTDILEKNNLKGEFTLYLNSFEAMWSLIEENIDVIIVPDETLVSIILSGPPVEVIASFNVNSPVALVVPPHSPAKRIADLKKGNIANPIDVIRLAAWLKNAGLKPDEVNILQKKDTGTDLVDYYFIEAKADALVLRGALLADSLKSNKVKVITEDIYALNVIILKRITESKVDAVISFLVGLQEAFAYQQSNQAIVQKWLEQVSPLWPDVTETSGFSLSLTDKPLNLSPKLEEVQPAITFIRNPDAFSLLGHLKNDVILFKGGISFADFLTAEKLINKTLFEKAQMRFNRKIYLDDVSQVKILHQTPPTIPFSDVILQRFAWKTVLDHQKQIPQPQSVFKSELIIIKD